MRALFSLLTLLIVSACGGGGGGGGPGQPPAPPPPPPPPPPQFVSGQVEAPNGQIARNWPLYGVDKWLAVFVPNAAAAIPGLSPVPDGTPVELRRLNPDGSVAATLADTTTTGGQYSFNMTELGLPISDDLIVTALGGAGIELRALVGADSSNNVDPVSEFVSAEVLGDLGSGNSNLNDFTPEERDDLEASAELIALTQGIEARIDVPATVAEIRAAALADPGFVTFFGAASQPGESAVGPGDIGNYFPFVDGYSWTLDGSISVDGGAPEFFRNVLLVDGTRDVNGTETTVLVAIDSSDPTSTVETLLVKDDRGVSDWTPVETAGNSLDLVRFPLKPGSLLFNSDAIQISLEEDIDGDGVIETVRALFETTVVGFENLVVAGGTFPNSARIESNLSFSGTLSGGGGDFSGSIESTDWYAPDIGQVRSDAVLDISTSAGSASGIILQELTDGVFLVAKGIRANDALGVMPVAGDGYLVVACDDQETPLGFYASRVPGSGRVTGTTFIGEPHYLQQCEPDNAAAAWDGTNFLVAFAKTDNANNTNIVAVRVSPDGAVLDSPEIVVSSGASNFGPAVAFDGTNYLIVWQKFDLLAVPANHEIYGARISPDGTNLGEFPIFTEVGEQVFADVSFDGSNYLVVWRDTRSGSGPADDTDVYGVRVTPAGAVLDDPAIPIVTAPRVQGEPKVASGGGNWLVVWNDIGDLGTSPPPDGRIFGRRVAADGSVLDGAASTDGIAIATAPVANYGATVGYLGDSYFVAWSVGSYPSLGTAGIYGATVSTDGQLVGGSADTLGPSISGTPPDNSRYDRPRIASTGQDALLIWVELGNIVNVFGDVIEP